MHSSLFDSLTTSSSKKNDTGSNDSMAKGKTRKGRKGRKGRKTKKN